uniref:Glutathione transferase delta-like Yv4019D08 n=1 Tax=Sarcoptes scabiei TaxID=52283 RepID=Q2YFE7_SARSC|nr:glutathione transferase delta-like Yv4019D08 [Sarcoptes scabiei]
MGSIRPIIYWMAESPPCRTLYAVTKLLGIDCEWKVLDLSQKEHMKPDFLTINPFHCVPTMVESDGFKLWESRVICKYLIESRNIETALYPKDLKKRAIIDRCLHFDLGTLYRALADVVYDAFYVGKPNLAKLPRLEEVLQMMEDNLAKTNSNYLAQTDEPTLADISTYFSLSILEIVSEFDLAKYFKLFSWKQRMNEFIKSIDDGTFATGQANIIAFAKKMMDQHKA